MINQALSPIKKDIYVTLDLVVENRSGDFVFREEQYIKVGNRVWIQFPNYNFNGAEILTITDTL